MINIVYWTDPHMRDSKPQSRIDDFYQTQFNKLEFLLNSGDLKDKHFICGGDFFDEPYVSYQLVNRVIQLFQKYPGVQAHSLIGNHDTIGYSTDAISQTALGLLFQTQTMKCLTKLELQDKDKKIVISGIHTRKHFSLDEYKKLSKVECDVHVIVNHDILTDTPTIFEHAMLDDVYASLNKNRQYYVLCAHYHRPYEKKFGNVTFVNPGCYTRQSIKEAEYQPRFAVITIDGDKLSHTYVNVPHDNKVFLRREEQTMTVQQDTTSFINQLKSVQLEQHNLVEQVKLLAKNFDVQPHVINELVTRIEKEIQVFVTNHGDMT